MRRSKPIRDVDNDVREPVEDRRGRRQLRTMVAYAGATLLMVAAAAAASERQTTVLAFETEWFDFETGTITRTDLSPAERVGADIRVGYNSDRTSHAVVVPNLATGARIVRLAGKQFESVNGSDVNDQQLLGELIDEPFGSGDTVILRTAEGHVFKLGNPIETGGYVVFDYERLDVGVRTGLAGETMILGLPVSRSLVVTEDVKLTASDGAAGDNFGFSAAISGSTAVIGERFGNAAYVFEFDGSVWSEQAILTQSDGQASDEFGFDVDISGDTIVVGAPLHKAVVTDDGAAYVFEKPAGGWVNMTETHKIIHSSPEKKDKLGWSVSLSGNTLLAGATGRFAPTPGAAYVFEFDGLSWIQKAELTASDSANGDEFGIYVAASPTNMVVGAHQHDVNGQNSGAAYVFEKPGGGWVDMTQTAKLLPGDGAANDVFGQAVAISGDTIAVGARKDNDGGFDTGSVYVFDKPVGGWADMTQTQKLHASDAQAGDEFGRAPAMRGDTLVVGAPKGGSAYLFERSGGIWTEEDKLMPSDGAAGDEYGFVAAISDVAILVGARFGDAVYVFDASSICTTDPQCDDGLYCNGAETCNLGTGTCQAGTPPVCDDGAFCNGVETCNEGTDSCDPGSAPCDPGLETCNEGSDVCEPIGCTLDSECDDTLFCNGFETCVEGGCNAGAPPACDDSLFCNGTETCNEATDGCDAGAPPVCDDGAFCNGVETCNEATDSCAAGAPPICDDGVFCNGVEACNEATDGCDAGTPPVCDDGDLCTGVEACNETTDSCDPGTAVVCGPGEICEPLTGLCESCDSLTASEDAKLTASDGVVGENFGFTAAISGTTAVVGERFGNAAYVFEFNGSVWSQQAILTKSDGGTTDEFGFDVTISGDTIAVGAPFHNAVVPDDGAVYVFVKPAGGWVDMTETYKITHSSPETKDQLGWSVSLSGNTLLAGATGRFAPTPGAAYVFEFDGLSWIQKAELTASDSANGDEFGISVEASPATLVVGAHQNDVNGSNSGSAYVFEKPAGGWIDMNQTAILSPSDPGNNDFYGQAVDISGDTIVVAARKDNDGGFDTGSVYAFDKPAGGWVDMSQTQKLTASDAQAGDEFGRAPAILGDTLVVGAPKAAAAAGSAYVFERNGGTWTEAGKLMPSDGAAGEEYGFVTALSQVSIVVGARFGDSVYAFNEELVAHWTFDEGVGSIATDASVFGNDGSLISGAGWTSGHTGDGGDFAVALDGVDDHVNAGSDQSLDTLAALTYSAWVYPTATGDREILSKANSTHEFRLKGTGTLRGCIIASGPNSCSDSVSGAVPLNTWTHVAMTYDHSGDRQVHLYINGLEVSYAGQSTAGGTLASDAALPQLLGRRQSGSDRRSFAGALDEMQIYNEALPSCRIEELADPGGCLIDADCDDGLSCNGAETCNVGTGACEAGTPTVCDDGAFCNGVETCNESTDSCDPGTPPACDDGAFCNGAETCNEVTDSCDPGTPPVCDNGAFCDGVETCNESTDDCDPGSAPCDPGLETCNEGSDICESIGCTLDSECDDTLFCNGFETCVEGGCNAGAPPDCDDSLFCNGTETCNEATDNCDAGTPPACDDGLFCNGTETCNESADSCDPGTTVDCSDAIGCTVDTCNEGTDSCDRIATDSLCADGDLCNGVETCDALLDCQAGTAIICDEGLVCEPATGICGSACASGDVALVGHWTFDEGTGPVASDSSGLGNDGGLKNGAGWAGGHTGGGGDFAVALDGVNDHVDAGSGSSLDNLAALTYSAWVLPTATGDREIFSKANSTHELRLKGSGTLRGCIVASGPDACSESASGAVPLNTWTHVAMTYDHSGDRQVHLYVNGIEVSYASQSTAGATLASDAPSAQILGRRQNGSRSFAGSLDEMRIYDQVVEECRLEELAGF